MKSQQKIVLTLAACLISMAATARAQQNSPLGGGAATPNQPLPPENNGGNAPVPGARGLFVGSPQEQVSSNPQPDQHFLSGAESFGVGALNGITSLFDPSIFVSESVDNGVSAIQLESVTQVGASLTFDRNWSHYSIITLYRGAQTFDRPNGLYNTSFHDLSVAQSMRFGRWAITLRDDFLYSPQTSFGGLDNGVVSAASGFATPVLNPILPSFTPSDTIATGRASRFNNTGVAEVDYSITRRSTVTFSGSYGLLQFVEPGYVNSRSINGSAGYNYALNAKNTIAIVYGYNQNNYSGENGTNTAHSMQAAFGRKITGRLSMQLSGGPQLVLLSNQGSPTSHRYSWTAFGSLNYQRRRTGYALSYSHGLNSGSGVFLGAENDTASLALHRSLTGYWSSSFSVGYSRNSSLSVIGGPADLFQDLYTSVNLYRQIGPHIRFTTFYEFQHETTTEIVCPVVACGTTPNRHSGGVTLEWHPAQLKIE